MRRPLATLALLGILGFAANVAAGPAITHAFHCTQPGSSDPAVIDCPKWNADHVVDPLALAAAARNQAASTFEIWTDSNGMGPPTDVIQDDPADNTGVRNANVTYRKIYTSNFTEPVTPVEMGTGALRVENASGSPAHGPELAIGAVLDGILNGTAGPADPEHRVMLDQVSIHSSLLSQWQASATAGNASPLLGGGNLDDVSTARALTAQAMSGHAPAGAFMMLGTNDGSDTNAATAAGTNASALIAHKRAVHGSQLKYVWVVPQTTIPGGTYPFAATARANLLTALGLATGLSIVYAEDLPTADDLVHFVSVGQRVLGDRMGFAYVRLASLAERTVLVPTVVGVSPATYNGSAHGSTGFSGVPSTALRAWPWQGSKAGDTMFIASFKGTIGAGTAIPTPSGWTQVVSVSSTDAATVENRAALFSKQLLAGELSGNVASTGGPGFPITVSITPGGAQFSLKPFTVRGSTTIDGTPTGFGHTTIDTSAVTAPGVTTTGANRTVFVAVFAWKNSGGQTFTVTNGSLTGLTQIFGASYPSSSTNFLFMGLWAGTLPTAGPSGNSTVTPSAAASSCGFTWAM